MLLCIYVCVSIHIHAHALVPSANFLLQIWKKLQTLGDNIIALAKCLSNKTMTSFREQVDELACICLVVFGIFS